MRYTVMFVNDHDHHLTYWVKAMSPQEALTTAISEAEHYHHNNLTLIEILSERGERFTPDDVDCNL